MRRWQVEWGEDGRGEGSRHFYKGKTLTDLHVYVVQRQLSHNCMIKIILDQGLY